MRLPHPAHSGLVVAVLTLHYLVVESLVTLMHELGPEEVPTPNPASMKSVVVIVAAPASPELLARSGLARTVPSVQTLGHGVELQGRWFVVL